MLSSPERDMYFDMLLCDATQHQKNSVWMVDVVTLLTWLEWDPCLGVAVAKNGCYKTARGTPGFIFGYA